MKYFHIIEDAAIPTTSVVNLSLILLIIGVPCIIGICTAQYFLVKAKNPYLGWILPVLSFMIGVIISFQWLTFNEPLTTILFRFFLPQITTVIFLLLLGVSRSSRTKKQPSSITSIASSPNEIKRMNIHDL